jgi:hypothetical protein
LTNAFKLRVQRGEIVLTGTPTAKGAPQRVVISANNAARLRFDPPSGAAFVGVDTIFYVAVTAWRDGMAPTDGAVVPGENGTKIYGGGIPKDPITEKSSRELTDAEIFHLLEEHARRVCEGPDAVLFPAGKISLMPIIRRKMHYRHEMHLTRETLSAEADELAEWIALKVPSHQVPTVGAIRNAMRSFYRKPDA